MLDQFIHNLTHLFNPDAVQDTYDLFKELRRFATERSQKKSPRKKLFNLLIRNQAVSNL